MTLEESLFRQINSLAGQQWLVDYFMIAISNGNTWIMVSALVVAAALFARSEKLLSMFLSAAIALGVADFVSFRFVKQIVARERPCRLLEDVHLVLNQCGGSYGFTSNHASNAFAVWVIVAFGYGLRSSTSLACIWLASLVALSRVYLGVHFVGDILGGALLGSLLGVALVKVGLFYFSNHVAKQILSYLPSTGK